MPRTLEGMTCVDLTQNVAGPYCTQLLSDFGDKGPLKELPGYDPLAQAYSGIISVNGHPGSAPARVVVPIVDVGSGMWLFIGILAALPASGPAGVAAGSPVQEQRRAGSAPPRTSQNSRA